MAFPKRLGGTDSWSANTSTMAYKNYSSFKIEMVVVWAVVDAFVSALSVPLQVAQTLIVDMVVVWAVIDVCVGQLFVPSQVAQTRHYENISHGLIQCRYYRRYMQG